jgi:hypothetical protein
MRNVVFMSIDEIRQYLKTLGLPSQDNHELPTSQKSFPDGAQFRTEELPTTPEEYEKMFSLCEKHGFVVNRISDISGVMFNTDAQILRKLELARQHGTEVFMGPGAGERLYDTSQQAALGQITHGKIRGMDQIAYTIRSMLRAAELGCRGFFLYDEGLLPIACKMRGDGRLPPETKFKISANLSVANASAIKFWFDKLGPQDTINPIRDLTLPMISEMRQVTNNALDMHIFWSNTLARTMEAPEIVRITSPVYFKNSRSGPGIGLEDRLAQSICLVELIEKQYPKAKQSKPGAKDLCVPASPSAKW